MPFRIPSVAFVGKAVLGAASGVALTWTGMSVCLDSPKTRQNAWKKEMEDEEFQPIKEVVLVAETTLRALAEPTTKRDILKDRPTSAYFLDRTSSVKSQPYLLSKKKKHSLLLWLHVEPKVDAREVASRAAFLDLYVQQVQGRYRRKDELVAGVGFGPEFYCRVNGRTPRPFNNEKHHLLSGSDIGGDILFHLKANQFGKLRQLREIILKNLPENSIKSMDETYSQQVTEDHPKKLLTLNAQQEEPIQALPETEASKQKQSEQNKTEQQQEILGKEMSRVLYTNELQAKAFPARIPAENKKGTLIFIETGDEDPGLEIKTQAIDPRTGGTYVLAQKWLRSNPKKSKTVIRQSSTDTQDDTQDGNAWEEQSFPLNDARFKSTNMSYLDDQNYVKEDMRLQRIPESQNSEITPQGHGDEISVLKEPPPFPFFQTVRHTIPIKAPKGSEGLFFLSYSKSPDHNEQLLERLIHVERKQRAEQVNSEVSTHVKTASWYFPGLQELNDLT